MTRLRTSAVYKKSLVCKTGAHSDPTLHPTNGQDCQKRVQGGDPKLIVYLLEEPMSIQHVELSLVMKLGSI